MCKKAKRKQSDAELEAALTEKEGTLLGKDKQNIKSVNPYLVSTLGVVSHHGNNSSKAHPAQTSTENPGKICSGRESAPQRSGQSEVEASKTASHPRQPV